MPLLKYMGDKMIANPGGCRTMTSFELFTIIQAFANNCFIPESQESNENVWKNRILPEILANENLIQIEPSSNVWLPFTLQLVILGHFDQTLISRVLSTSYLNEYLRRKDLSALDLYKILILYQTVAMNPDTDKTALDSKMILKVCQRYTEQIPTCDIQTDLIDHYGKSCVLTNVRTKFMHLIPTLMIINKETGHIEKFPDDIERDDNGFILLDEIPCLENEVL